MLIRQQTGDITAYFVPGGSFNGFELNIFQNRHEILAVIMHTLGFFVDNCVSGKSSCVACSEARQ